MVGIHFFLKKLSKWQTCEYLKKIKVSYIKLFFIEVFFHNHRPLTRQKGKAQKSCYSSVPLPPTYKHSDMSLQFFISDGHLVFLNSAHVITKLLLIEICPYLKISMWLIHCILLDTIHLSLTSSEFEPAQLLHIKSLKYLRCT